jgi:hypothetical protein
LYRKPEQPLPCLHARLAQLARVLHRRQLLIEAFELWPISSRRGAVGEGDWQQMAAVHSMVQGRFQPLL